eukprot:SM000128S26245  [mRNA]  locus=s128:396114:400764:+ [translate_table: standard]
MLAQQQEELGQLAALQSFEEQQQLRELESALRSGAPFALQPIQSGPLASPWHTPGPALAPDTPDLAAALIQHQQHRAGHLEVFPASPLKAEVKDLASAAVAAATWQEIALDFQQQLEQSRQEKEALQQELAALQLASANESSPPQSESGHAAPSELFLSCSSDGSLTEQENATYKSHCTPEQELVLASDPQCASEKPAPPLPRPTPDDADVPELALLMRDAALYSGENQIWLAHNGFDLAYEYIACLTTTMTPFPDFVGKRPHDIMPPNLCKEIVRLEALKAQVICTGEAVREEIEHPGYPDDNDYISLHAVWPRRDGQGVILGVCTASCYLSKNLLEARRELQAMSKSNALYRRKQMHLETALQAMGGNLRAKYALLFDIGEAIQRPLKTFSQLADMLAASGLTARQKQLVATMRACGGELLTMVNKMISINASKVGGHSIEIDFYPEVLMDIASKSVGSAAAGRNVSVIHKVEETVPKQLLGDPMAVLQLCQHMCLRLLDITSGGGCLLLHLRKREGAASGNAVDVTVHPGVRRGREEADDSLDDDDKRTRHVTLAGEGDFAARPVLDRSLQNSQGADFGKLESFGSSRSQVSSDGSPCDREAASIPIWLECEVSCSEEVASEGSHSLGKKRQSRKFLVDTPILHVCRQLVVSMGGELAISRHKGSLAPHFVFTFPCKVPLVGLQYCLMQTPSCM